MYTNLFIASNHPFDMNVTRIYIRGKLLHELAWDMPDLGAHHIVDPQSITVISVEASGLIVDGTTLIVK